MTLSPPAVDLTAETTDFLTADERRSPQIQKLPKTHLQKICAHLRFKHSQTSWCSQDFGARLRFGLGDFEN